MMTSHVFQVGKAMAIAALDLTESNPWSRLILSEYASIHGVRDWVRRYIRGLRGLPRGPINRTQRQLSKSMRLVLAVDMHDLCA